MKITKLRINCPMHGKDINAVATMGGDIMCSECQKIYSDNHDHEMLCKECKIEYIWVEK